MTNPKSPLETGAIVSVAIEDEMKRSYLDYAMSVIVSRALPDVRDGLKPVHRRILYAMKEGGYDSGKPYKKSARIVGDVMGKYHPHGDSAIYDAMVRMAQDFSMQLLLVDGQGNFGSMDGDPPAAMRYTEARLTKAAETLLADIDQETVDFRANYDESTFEPVVLPSRFPNLLVNGAGGIAVGMATNIPPHNLGEIIDACLAIIADPSVSDQALLDIVPGPDFPTGGLILGRNGIRAAYGSGRGSLVVRARSTIETSRQKRESIVVTEIPYQINKARLIERIADAVREKTIEGIAEIRDESDRDGVRVVIDLKKDAVAEVILAQLHRHTPLQTTFGVNMVALESGQPRQMTLSEVIRAFLSFRETVITRRTAYSLRQARSRAHILAGLLVAIANLDPVIALIREAQDPAIARSRLTVTPWPAATLAPFLELADAEPERALSADGTYRLSEDQARAILELRLQRLTGLERDRLTAETEELAVRIEEFLKILASHSQRMAVIRTELEEIRAAFATPRRTTLLDSETAEVDEDQLIQREDMVVTVTHGGYIKRTPLAAYRAQRRGGKGRSGMATRDDDCVTRVLATNTHALLLFFSSAGQVYQMKVYRLPQGAPQARGKAMINLLPLEKDEVITAVLAMPEAAAEEAAATVQRQSTLMFATASGHVRRNALADFTNIKASGKICMKLQDGDRLVTVWVCHEDEDVLLATAHGRAIRFPVGAIRIFSGRSALGVRGITLEKNDEVLSMTVLAHGSVDAEARDIYLQAVNARRRLASPTAGSDPEDSARDQERAALLEQEPYASMAQTEEFILTVSSSGMGQLCSAYGYRETNRGGKGVANMDLNGARAVASFLIDPARDQVMLVSGDGQIIRMAAADIRPVSRNSKGVRLFQLGAGREVVSVARLLEPNADAAAEGDETA